jgi:hypothetical protein
VRHYIKLVLAFILESLIKLIPFVLLILFMLLGSGGDFDNPSDDMLALTVILFVVAVLAVLCISLCFALAPQAMVLDKYGPFASLRRSCGLVFSAFWRVLGLELVVVVIYLVAQLPASFLRYSLLPGGGSPASAISVHHTITTILSGVGLIIAVPLHGIIATCLYYDLRVRMADPVWISRRGQGAIWVYQEEPAS